MYGCFIMAKVKIQRFNFSGTQRSESYVVEQYLGQNGSLSIPPPPPGSRIIYNWPIVYYSCYDGQGTMFGMQTNHPSVYMICQSRARMLDWQSSHTSVVYMYILIWLSFVQADIANQYVSYIYISQDQIQTMCILITLELKYNKAKLNSRNIRNKN